MNEMDMVEIEMTDEAIIIRGSAMGTQRQGKICGAIDAQVCRTLC